MYNGRGDEDALAEIERYDSDTLAELCRHCTTVRDSASSLWERGHWVRGYEGDDTHSTETKDMENGNTIFSWQLAVIQISFFSVEFV